MSEKEDELSKSINKNDLKEINKNDFSFDALDPNSVCI
jgi:hypothetical protein